MKLKAERAGILMWLVAGCLDWQRHGLGEPEAVKAATSKYASDEDTPGQFLDECCEIARWARVKASDLLGTYINWSGDKTMTVRKLAPLLKSRGVEEYRNNGVWYSGIGLVLTDGTDARTEF
ncbi:MAG: hypothetical protein NTW96_24840 [Planctomycetia bacterium]|nr:hypothetical protein [Planctomycetia bacterium]